MIPKEMKYAGASEVKGVGGPLGTAMRVTRVSRAVRIRGINSAWDVLVKGKPFLQKEPKVVEQADVTVMPTLAFGKKGKEILQNRAEKAARGSFVRWRKVN